MEEKVECYGSGQLRYILFLQVRWQPLPVNAGPSPLGLDGQLQGVGQLFLPLLVRLPLPRRVSSSVDRQNRLSLLFQHLAVVSVAVVVELEPSGEYGETVHIYKANEGLKGFSKLLLSMIPVLSAIAFHQVSVWIEEDAPVVVDTGDPDRRARCFQPRPKSQVLRLLLVVVPHQEADVVALQNPGGQLSKSSTHLGCVHDPVVKVGRATSRDHQVGEAESHCVVLPDEGRVSVLLEVVLRLLQPLGEDEAVEEEGKTSPSCSGEHAQVLPCLASNLILASAPEQVEL